MARTQRWLKHLYVNVNNPYNVYVNDDLDSEGTLSALSDTEDFDDHLLDENNGPFDENSCLLDGNNSVLDENRCLPYENNNPKDSLSNDIGDSTHYITLPIMHLGGSSDFTLPFLHEGRIRNLAQNCSEPAKLLVEPTVAQNCPLPAKLLLGPIPAQNYPQPTVAQNYPEPAAELLVEPTPELCRDFSNKTVIGMRYFYLLMGWHDECSI